MGWVGAGERSKPGVVAAGTPYLEGVRAQNPHGCQRRGVRAVPVALGAVSAGDMAPGELSQPRRGARPAAPRPAQRRLRRTAGLSRIGPRRAPAGWGQGWEWDTRCGSGDSRGTKPAAAVRGARRQ